MAKRPLRLILLLLLASCGAAWRVTAAIQSRGDATDENGAIHYRATHEAILALTFDDGPDPSITPRILETLKRHGVHATFFVLGARAQEYPQVIRQLLDDGNEIANHGFTHSYRINSPATVRNEIERTQSVIQQATGVSTQFFRPPGGIHNPMVVKAAASVGHRVIMWSWNQDTKDWAHPGAKRIAAHILANARPGDIVLLHDGPGQQQTADALDEVITGLQARHYRLVTIGELLAESTPALGEAGP
ncbi:MAG TPA: polysaccharide deacetylase family protein [Limnochordia bacterium]|nr:polysaccharide deacetylase family protein [Limnochordia bacterium]